MALRVGHVFLPLALLLGGKLLCCFIGFSGSAFFFPFFFSLSLFFASFTGGGKGGWVGKEEGRGRAGTGGVGGEFGEVFPCLGWPLYGVSPHFGGEGREAVYTNNRLRTGTDKGNPTV